MVCGCSFTGAMIWQYETMRAHAKKIREMFDNQQEAILVKRNEFRQHMNSLWNNLSSGQKMVWTIISLNIGVFVLWKIPGMNGFMLKHFFSSPFPGHSLSSMFLSAFSHSSGLHLLCNMYVFWSFSHAALSILNKEQMLAVYCSGAVISSFASYVFKIARSTKVPSLGASGAVLSILGLVCTANPDSRLTIAFIGEIFPFSFSADSGLKALIAFDAVGLLLGWKVFDHAAHLGGVLFGIWYIKYGRNMIWNRREKVMKTWHSIRGNPK